jgi:hypothetical protein
MKYHDSDQIQRIARLQEEAAKHIQSAHDLLKEADELTVELRAAHGTRFVCKGVAYQLEHRARQFEPGNRDWLVHDREVRIIE